MLLTRALLPALVVVLGTVAIATPAAADRAITREAMERLEEIIELRREDGQLDVRDAIPTILVDARPRYEESAAWFPVRSLSVLTRSFGMRSVRLCEACMGVRTQVLEGRIEQQSGAIGLDEIARLDDRYRGGSPRAKTATWFTETRRGVAMRMVDLTSGRVVFATLVEPDLRTRRASARTFSRAAEWERRGRRDAITHAFFDAAFYPGQHVSIEWSDQWGDDNSNLAGVVFSFFDPVVGIGASYHRILPFLNMTVGTQLILSVPTALASAFTDQDVEIIDPAVTAAVMLRVPFGRDSNYAGLLSVSTNGNIGLGVSFLNTSFIPILP